jgi:hypothetical protein
MRFAVVAVVVAGCGPDEAPPPVEEGCDPIDAAACEADPVRWDCDICPMIDTYCVSCHHTAPDDFRVYDDVVPLADKIACGVATAEIRPESCGDAWPPAEQFPAGDGPHPSDADRQEIVDWVAAGAPE